MAKNLLSFRYSHTCGGRSASLWFTSHSSTMRHTSSHGPSRKACSSGVNCACGKLCSLCQSGLPLKISPSHHTVPASMASCSVRDISGIIFLKIFRTGRVRLDLRNDSTFRARAITANTNQLNIPKVPLMIVPSAITAPMVNVAVCNLKR